MKQPLRLQKLIDADQKAVIFGRGDGHTRAEEGDAVEASQTTVVRTRSLQGARLARTRPHTGGRRKGSGSSRKQRWAPCFLHPDAPYAAGSDGARRRQAQGRGGRLAGRAPRSMCAWLGEFVEAARRRQRAADGSPRPPWPRRVFDATLPEGQST